MMKWFEYKEIGIGISINIDYIDSLSDILDWFLISESASGTGFRSRYLHWYGYQLLALPITWALQR
jgi:hypothetical protein